MHSFAMKHEAPLAVVLGLMLCAPPMLAQATDLPLNSPTKVDGVEAVCTGIGENEENNPKWAVYPLKIETVGKGAQWLADTDVSVLQGETQVFAAHCGAPWLLLKLAPGKYQVSATSAGESATTKAYSPRHGQGTVILRFPNEGGTVSPFDLP